MNGFKTARALVIDDEHHEAMMAIQSLGHLSIGCVYHDGDCPAEGFNKYSGMRLLVLDMVLSNRGAPGNDPATDMSVLIGALEELINPGSDTLVAVCWTKHAETAQLLQAAFQKTFPDARLAAVIVAEKGDLGNPAALRNLSQKITDALSCDGPNSLLRDWEQLVHDATTKTTAALYELTQVQGNGPVQWLERAFRIGATLAIAERGTRLKWENGQSAVKAFAGALVPLLADSIEHTNRPMHHATDTITNELHKHVRQVLDLGPKDTPLLDQDSRAKLNTRLNISTEVVRGDVVPGNVYTIVDDSSNQKEIRNILASSVWESAFHDTFFELAEAQDGPVAVIVEMTPSCDYAQANCKLHRFCIGYLFRNIEEGKLRSSADYLRYLGPFFLERNMEPSCYSLVLNSHFLFGVTKKIATKLEPLIRIRGSALADVIAWQCAHSSRPGYVSVY
jgi:hypothetical protein